MVETIRLRDVATYSKNVTQELNGLSKLNFVFGCNGTGKTTISRLLANPDAYPSCGVKWQGDQALKTLVYNPDFVTRNFAQSSQIKGIFTLGEEQVETTNRIAFLRHRVAEFTDTILSRRRTVDGDAGRGGLKHDVAELLDNFTEACWAAKKAHDGSFAAAFSGISTSKSKFRDRVLTELANNNAPIRSLHQLADKASSVFHSNGDLQPLLLLNSLGALLDIETNPVLAKVIVGRGDVDIAAMMQRLRNSDWVRAGIDYFNNSDGVCPFCQQVAPSSLESSLTAYFNEAFAADLASIKDLILNYRAHAKNAHNAISALLDTNNHFLGIDALDSLLTRIGSHWRANLNLLESKAKEPSQIVQLRSSEALWNEGVMLVERANQAITSHNELIRNRTREQRLLTSEVWRYLLDVDLASSIQHFQTNHIRLQTLIATAEEDIKAREFQRSALMKEISTLEKATTSVTPTIDYINTCLSDCGFTGFRLEATELSNNYRLVRDDGSHVEETLSEGERSFVTFLYFYHLVQGSSSQSGTVEPRVIVIDDPVSSLDSNVLFAVSALVRDLFVRIEESTVPIRQLILLTHNVYFHKEATCYPPHGVKLRFWVVRKQHGISHIERKEKNPVSNSYELLWQELRRGDLSLTTLQNTYRRILENYFTMLGGINRDQICSYFTGTERQICKSLFSWVNAGSHDVLDDLYASTDDFTIENYQDMFKKIFDKTDHGAHFTMMMRL